MFHVLGAIAEFERDLIRDRVRASHSPRPVDADRLLKRRWKQIGAGRFTGPSEERWTVNQLLDAVEVWYRVDQGMALRL